jgi:transposase
VKAYGFITEDVARSKNRLKAAYRSEGVPTKEGGLYRAGSKASWTGKLDAGHQAAAGFLHDALDAQDGLKEAATAALVKEARKHAAFALLQTIPGLGPIRAAQVLSVVVTPSRFRTKRQFWAYCGLAVVTHSSSDWVQHGGTWQRQKVQQTRGLNKNYNHVLKNVFKSAAMTVIGMGPDCALRRDYERMLKNGTKPNLACVTLARKLAAITLAVWKSKQPYHPPAEEKQDVDDKALTT